MKKVIYSALVLLMLSELFHLLYYFRLFILRCYIPAWDNAGIVYQDYFNSRNYLFISEFLLRNPLSYILLAGAFWLTFHHCVNTFKLISILFIALAAIALAYFNAWFVVVVNFNRTMAVDLELFNYGDYILYSLLVCAGSLWVFRIVRKRTSVVGEKGGEGISPER